MLLESSTKILLLLSLLCAFTTIAVVVVVAAADTVSASGGIYVDGRLILSSSLPNETQYALNHPTNKWWQNYKASKPVNSTSRFFPNETEAATMPHEPYDDPVHSDGRRVIKGIDLTLILKNDGSDDGNNDDVEYTIQGNFSFSYDRSAATAAAAAATAAAATEPSRRGEAYFYKLYALNDDKGYRMVFDAPESRRRTSSSDSGQMLELSYKISESEDGKTSTVSLKHRSDSATPVNSSSSSYAENNNNNNNNNNNCDNEGCYQPVSNLYRDGYDDGSNNITTTRSEKILRRLLASSASQSNGDGGQGGENLGISSRDDDNNGTRFEPYVVDEFKFQLTSHAGSASAPLKLVQADLPWGRWTTAPPQQVNFGSTVGFGCRGTAFAGYEANVRYKFDDQTGWVGFHVSKEYWDGRTLTIEFENKAAFEARYALSVTHYAEAPQRFSLASYLRRTLGPAVSSLVRDGVYGGRRSDDAEGISAQDLPPPMAFITIFDRAPDSFRVMMSGDPQPYRLNEPGNDPNSDEHNWSVSNIKRSVQILNDHLSAGTTKDSSPFTFGIVLGDLTEYGRVATRTAYVITYEKTLPFPLYVGLGNHDYENNVGECWEMGYLTKNGCAMSAVRDMSDRMSVYERTSLNYHQDWTGTAGSLAYRFDYGRYRFYQLHNYPSYEVDLQDGVFHYDVRPSLDWFEQQLKAAESESPKPWHVVLLHDQQFGKNHKDLERFESLMKTYGVRLMFAGHTHAFSRTERKDWNYWIITTGALFDETNGGYYSVVFQNDGCVKIEERKGSGSGSDQWTGTVCYGVNETKVASIVADDDDKLEL